MTANFLLEAVQERRQWSNMSGTEGQKLSTQNSIPRETGFAK